MPVNEELLGAAEAFLEQDPDVLVPVEKVWKTVCSISSGLLPSVEEFFDALCKDSRFEVLPFEWMKNFVSPDSASVDATKHDLFENIKPVVKLRCIALSPARITSIMAKKVEETISLLMKAWELRPENDETAEDQLLQILLQAQKLQQELQVVIKDISKNETGHARLSPEDIGGQGDNQK